MTIGAPILLAQVFNYRSKSHRIFKARMLKFPLEFGTSKCLIFCPLPGHKQDTYTVVSRKPPVFSPGTVPKDPRGLVAPMLLNPSIMLIAGLIIVGFAAIGVV